MGTLCAFLAARRLFCYAGWGFSPPAVNLTDGCFILTLKHILALLLLHGGICWWCSTDSGILTNFGLTPTISPHTPALYTPILPTCPCHHLLYLCLLPCLLPACCHFPTPPCILGPGMGGGLKHYCVTGQHLNARCPCLVHHFWQWTGMAQARQARGGQERTGRTGRNSVSLSSSPSLLLSSIQKMDWNRQAFLVTGGGGMDMMEGQQAWAAHSQTWVADSATSSLTS